MSSGKREGGGDMSEKWTQEREAELRRLWDDGLSCSQIASELGGITRNAVMGKVHRLGFPKRKDVDGARSVSVAPLPLTKRVVQLRGLKRMGGGNVRVARLTPAPAAVAAPIRSAEGAMFGPWPQLDILQLTDKTCRWPFGGAASYRFCGCPTVAPGLRPYCEAHEAEASGGTVWRDPHWIGNARSA